VQVLGGDAVLDEARWRRKVDRAPSLSDDRRADGQHVGNDRRADDDVDDVAANDDNGGADDDHD
jgi:hypothetical protein